MNSHRADNAVAFVREVSADPAREADARRATSLLYHATSAAQLAWEASRIHAMRGDARRLLSSRLVVMHRVEARDPFAGDAGGFEDRVAALLLGAAPVAMSDAAALVLHEI